MSCSLQLQGSLISGGSGCGCSSGDSGGRVIPIALACATMAFGAVVATDCAQQVQTLGAPGDNWVELPVSDAVGAVQLVYVKASNAVRLRIGAAPAELLGAAGTFPTGFVGGESLDFTVDGVAVAVTFTSGAQSAAQVAAQINQAAIGAGLSYLPASVQTNGQLALRGARTGAQGTLLVTDANATIGFPDEADVSGEGADVPVSGIFLAQFDTLAAPERIQISGIATVEVLLAGTAPTA
jgi:hypothetical protein